MRRGQASSGNPRGLGAERERSLRLHSAAMSNEELLDSAWAAYEDGDHEAALAECARLPETDSDRWLLESAARLRLGELDAAADALEKARSTGSGPDDPWWRLAHAEVAMYRWQLEEAERELVTIDHESLRSAALEMRSRVAELSGDIERADRLYRKAQELEPEVHPDIQRLDLDDFDAVVQGAIEDLPPEFQALLEESEVVVVPAPTAELLIPGRELETPPDLLGLFDGPSRLERAGESEGEPTPIVYLFQRNLERACAGPDELREQIRITLYHELGHLLGFDEEGVDELGLG